ncbi:unnamed protein product [Arabis nemorensis]|uniref:Uncharacterized protein n=1 Tax=Arabis nemorensis TaxID=586526 RepID=A0A565C5B8_9BRAS|nr:unnamed protein product [Arabis nemorensis]
MLCRVFSGSSSSQQSFPFSSGFSPHNEEVVLASSPYSEVLSFPVGVFVLFG